MIETIRQQFNEQGIAEFKNLQILDLAKTKDEVFVQGDIYYPVLIGKGAKTVHKNFKLNTDALVEIKSYNPGKYFYWYTRPTFNYYHMFLDSFGCLHRYFELKKQIPELQFMLNQSPNPKTGVIQHPPFVFELLDLLNITYQFTDEHAQYELVYFGDTLCNDVNGRRIKPHPEQYYLLKNLISLAHEKVKMPRIERIYLSRRAHANTLANRKDIIGEDNTVKRGLTNEDQVVEILGNLGYTEVFGENYTLAEKIVLFNQMEKYISTAGAGVTNIIFTMPNTVSVGGIHSAGFPFPGPDHRRHIVTNTDFIKATISLYPGKVRFVDETADTADYNRPWYINNLNAFEDWAKTI